MFQEEGDISYSKAHACVLVLIDEVVVELRNNIESQQENNCKDQILNTHYLIAYLCRIKIYLKHNMYT